MCSIKFTLVVVVFVKSQPSVGPSKVRAMPIWRCRQQHGKRSGCYYYSISFCSNLFEKPQTSFVITIICKMFCIGIGNCVLHLGLGLGLYWSVLLMCILPLMAEQLCVYKSK